MSRGYPDWSGPKVGVYLQPEWAAVEEQDKSVEGYSTADYGEYATVTYAVPSGKDFYITEFSGYCVAAAVANGDLPQHFYARLYYTPAGPLPLAIGGDGGFSFALPQPLKVPGGSIFEAYMRSFANHSVYLRVCASGYEV